MEGLCCLGIVVAVLLSIGYAIGRAGFFIGRRDCRPEPPARPAPVPRPVIVPQGPTAAERKRAEEKRRLANGQAKLLQMALFQLGKAPDFRRAATVAAAAKLVPVWFRRRQFARFRPQLVSHFRRSLAAGTDPEVLLESLRELVIALGAAEFEAEYIRSAAEPRAIEGPRVITPANQIAALRTDHEQRVAAIRDGVGGDGELRDQLLEAEEQRYREALLALIDNGGGTGR